MPRLEDLTRGARVKGILPDRVVTVVDVQWHGSAATLTYKDDTGRTGSELLFRDREASLEIVEAGRPWSFDGDGALLRLVAEAKRISLAFLFDPYLALSTSQVEPLPHQITAVYGEMLPRQPLRFLLADDPGAGKTVMTGLFIKELLLRGDLRRCLICAPGSLVEQWQDELGQKFGLAFDLITGQSINDSRTGNPFAEKDLVIARLDHMSRNEDVQARIAETDWDLIVCDEAHKMSASFFSGEVKPTKRYKLGRLLGSLTRHFLLLTATPHNGKEEEFQLFLALLDADRFEGKFRDGVHVVDASDLTRRMVKENLLKFDGTRLLPERHAYTVKYKLSDLEARLYERVTTYVRDEMDRADRIGDEGKTRTVGFALTTLQRRLASSPEAIYQSLRRRRERLEFRLREEQIRRRGAARAPEAFVEMRRLTEDDIEDLEDAPGDEVEKIEEEVVDLASAARTIAELEAEIATLKDLETLAREVRASGRDRKWEELSKLVQDRPEIQDEGGRLRKLVIFTEHRDTLNYLVDRIRALIGLPEAVVAIHGGVGREDRRKIQERFTQDKDVLVLVATDAAGEGINLQRAHLMVNYDLPWNPNRIEQRFGRVHRIGQTDVCHLWNLIAHETREGDVYVRLLEKLDVEREALGGSVFDVLGKVFQGTELRQLLIEAIRKGDSPEARARLREVVDEKMDREHLRALIEEHGLNTESMDTTQVFAIREAMERAAAQRLQPFYIRNFFMDAFRHLGGSIKERERDRYEITHVPAEIRRRDRAIGSGAPVLPKYERVCFEKGLIAPEGKPRAAFVSPGHPVLDATIFLVMERYRDLLKRGAVLVDPNDTTGQHPRVLYFLEHTVQDARTDREGRRRVISQRMQFVEIDPKGIYRAGPAPYLDYRPIKDEERALVARHLESEWFRGDLESKVLTFAIEHLAHEHLSEVRARREAAIAKTHAAVKDRLTKEINYWDLRAAELRAKEDAGKTPKINSAKARQRADELEARLKERLRELDEERQISALPPVVVGGALVVPAALLGTTTDPGAFARDQQERDRVEWAAMHAVMEIERSLGYEPRDVSAERCGYDIESRVPGEGRLRLIEVKGRIDGARTVTVTKNEVLKALNKPEDFILALVVVPPAPESPDPTGGVIGDGSPVADCRIAYVRRPFQREPDFSVESWNCDLADLLTRAGPPA